MMVRVMVMMVKMVSGSGDNYKSVTMVKEMVIAIVQMIAVIKMPKRWKLMNKFIIDLKNQRLTFP